MGWAGKPRIVPDKIGNRSYSNKATPPSKPAQSGNSTSQGFNPIEAIGSFIFGSNQQQNQNQGNTYNNTPVEQKNQKYVVSGYSDKTKYGGFASKEAQERALAAAMQKSASRFSGAWAKAGVPKHIISASIQYKPYGAGQQGAVSNSSPNQNVGQANIHNQSSTNAQPIPETTDNPYIITNGQAGLVGGYNGNTNTVDNVNVVPSAQNAALSSLAGLYVNAELKDGAQTSTINQTQNIPVDALVYVGDSVEEDIDRLGSYAGQLGLLGVPVFIFQEGFDEVAEFAFKQITKLTGGAFCRLDQFSSKNLAELLRAVAVFAAGGKKALDLLAKEKGGSTLKIAHQIQKD